MVTFCNFFLPSVSIKSKNFIGFRYIFGSVNQQELAAYYRDADVALITPLRSVFSIKFTYSQSQIVSSWGQAETVITVMLSLYQNWAKLQLFSLKMVLSERKICCFERFFYYFQKLLSLAKGHTKVIIVSAWLRTHHLSQGSQSIL